MESDLHDVLGTSVACNDSSGLASLNDALGARKLVERRLESALVNCLVGMCFLDCRKSIHRFYAFVRLTKLSNRLRQVEARPFCHLCTCLRGLLGSKRENLNMKETAPSTMGRTFFRCLLPLVS